MIKVTPPQPTADKIIKNIRFGTAVGLTKTAKQGQAAVQDALKSKFTIRNRWFEQQTPLGIKVTSATPAKLSASVQTAARFLPLQRAGGDKIPFGKHIAIPTNFARPNPGARIPAAFLPKALIASGKAFIETFKNGTKALSVHGLKKRGKYSDVVVMYILVPKAKIKAVDFWDGTLESVVRKSLNSNVIQAVEQALASMR